MFKQALEWVAQRDKSGIFSAWGEYKEMLEKNKLLLGFKGLGLPPLDERHGPPDFFPGYDFNEPVTIPFDESGKNFPRMLFIGRPGAGKTTFAQTVVFHQLFRVKDFHVFCIDPQAKMWTHKEPNPNPRQWEMLKKANLSPLGLPIITATPKFYKDSPKFEKTDRWWAVGYSDFQERIMERSMQSQLMLSILRAVDLAGAKDKLSEALMRGPKSWEDLLEKFSMLNREGRVGNKRFWEIRSAIDQRLSTSIKNGILSDDEPLHLVELLQENIVVIQCSLQKEEEVNSIYLSFAFAMLKEGFDQKKFKKPVCIFMDECDKVLPNGSEPPVKDQAMQAYVNWRADGAIPILVVQNPKMVDPNVISQTDIIFTPRINYGSPEEDAVRRFGSGGRTADLENLYWPENVNKYPKEWVAVNPTGISEPFFPPYCPSMTFGDVPRS